MGAILRGCNPTVTFHNTSHTHKFNNFANNKNYQKVLVVKEKH